MVSFCLSFSLLFLGYLNLPLRKISPKSATDRRVTKNGSNHYMVRKEKDQRLDFVCEVRVRGKYRWEGIWNTHMVYVKLTYLRQSPAAVPVFCLGTSKRAESGRSLARAETCYYTRMRKRRTGALRGSRKLLKMLSHIPDKTALRF